MKKIHLSIYFLYIIFIGCSSEKKYADYNEDEFYEVQGVIKKAAPTSNPFDLPVVKDIRYIYFLDRKSPKTGIEKNLVMFEAQDGLPLIVLVHKDDENISFYGRVGVVKNINPKEEAFLFDFIRNQMKSSTQSRP